MGGYVGYEPLLLPALRVRIIEAIEGLRELSSWDLEAASALAGVGSARIMLETDHLPAVDEALASEAMERLGFGVQLHGSRYLGRLRRASARLFPSSGPDDRFAAMADEELADWIGDVLARASSDGGPPAALDPDRLYELCEAMIELRRRVAAGDGFAEHLTERFADEHIRSGLLQFGRLLETSARQPPTGESLDPRFPFLNVMPIMLFSGLLNQIAAEDDDFDEWMLDHVEYGTVARAVLWRPGALTDHDLVVRVARKMTTAGSDAYGWYEEIDPEFGEVYEVLMETLAADPAMAADFLGDQQTRTAFLADTWSGDDGLMEGVTTSALMLPLLERSGERKSADQANLELRDGWAVWATAIDLNRQERLSVGSQRALASVLPLYLPSVEDQLLAENLNKFDGDGDETEQHRLIEASVADDRIVIGDRGGLATLLGTMSVDPVASARLASANYAFVEDRMQRFSGQAQNLVELQAKLRPADAFNELIGDGIELKETELRAEQTTVDGGLFTLLGLVLPTAERFVLRRSPWWSLATTPARKLLSADMSPDAVTLSRRIPLDHQMMTRIALLQVMRRADLPTRRKFGLDRVSDERWQQLDAALQQFWVAQDQQAIDAAEDRIEDLTDDTFPSGQTDPSGAAIATAVGSLVPES